MTEALQQRWNGRPEAAIRDIVLVVCAFLVLTSVAWSFLNFHGVRPVRRGRRSAVDTATMLVFFAGYSAILGRKMGVVTGMPRVVETTCIIAGLALAVVGCFVNVVGRLQLGPAWANQVAIYEGHELRVQGMYRRIRHPLYASLIWLFCGAAIANMSWGALLATMAVFVPAVYYRAHQEEVFLLESFPDYAAYRSRTGYFFPRLIS